MRVARYYRNDDIRIEEEPCPRPGPGELLVRIEASGICGSDVVEWYRSRSAPLVLGHEIAGVVEEAGEGVESFRPGDRVMATHHVPCNTCRHCMRQNHSLCDTLRTTRFDPGGFSEKVRLPSLNVDRGTFALPEQVSFEEGSFLEPLACCVRAWRVAGGQPGDAVLVLGAGISGALNVLLARTMGAVPVVATDPDPWRREMARSLGADAVLEADDDVTGRMKEIAGGRGADVVLVCTAAPSALEQAFRAAERGATVLMFALPHPGEPFPLRLYEAWRDQITLAHSYAGAPDDIAQALQLIASGRLDVKPLITHRLGLAETAEGFRLVAAASDSLKVIVEPQR